MKHALSALLAATLGLAAPAFAQKAAKQAAAKPATATAADLAKIRDEGLNRSQVMQTLSYLTDAIGPRLTGTPALRRANEWTRDELTRYGLANAHLEAWGPFGRGWTLEGFSAQMAGAQVQPLEAYPKAWSPGVDVKDGEVVWVNAKTDADLAAYKGKLRGKVVLNGPMPEVKPHFSPEAERHADSSLDKMAHAHEGEAGAHAPQPKVRTPEQEARFKARWMSAAFASRKAKFFADEGVALLLDPSRAGDGGNIFVQQAVVSVLRDTSSLDAFYKSAVPAHDLRKPVVVPQLAVAAEAYNRLVRMTQLGEKPRVTVHLAVKFNEDDPNAYNTLAELPGTDKKAELVMLGGHLDSWQGSTGATDNAAGVAVCMEAVRILKAAGLKPRRTVRIALWTGEEQGLYGSEAYVKEHFGRTIKDSTGKVPADHVPPRVATRPEWSKLSAYFNLDNGAGKVRGIYAQSNPAAKPIFEQWIAPFKDLGATTVTLQNTGGTDHLSYDEVGLPGFQFIQDELEYNTRTHHSTQDNYDRCPPDDLKQAAVLMAAFVYQAAMAEQMMPRKPVDEVKAKGGKGKGASQP